VQQAKGGYQRNQHQHKGNKHHFFSPKWTSKSRHQHNGNKHHFFQNLKIQMVTKSYKLKYHF